jgi:hypothetical protein
MFFPDFLIALLVSHRRPLLPEGRGIYDCGRAAADNPTLWDKPML